MAMPRAKNPTVIAIRRSKPPHNGMPICVAVSPINELLYIGSARLFPNTVICTKICFAQ